VVIVERPTEFFISVASGKVSFIEAFRNLDFKTSVHLALSAISLYLGASFAFSLGFIVALPWAMISFLSAESYAFILTQLTLMVGLSFIVFKISKLFVAGAMFQALLWRLKFINKKRVGQTHFRQAGYRFYFGFHTKVIRRGHLKRPIMIASIAMTVIFFGLTFFFFDEPAVSSTPSRFFLFAILIIFSFSAITGAATILLHSGINDKKSGNVLQVAGWLLSVGLFFSASLGVARALAMHQGPTLNVIVGDDICSLTPLMPTRLQTH
jgi:hypothetical protein